MSLISTIVPCEDIQSELNDFFVQRDNSTVMEVAGWLRFLTDPINRDGLSQMISPGGGKTKTVNLTYTQRLSETSNVGFDITCDPTREIGDTVESYAIDEDVDGNYDSFKISLATIRRNCKSNSMWFMQRLMMLINQLDRNTAQKMADQIPNVVGRFVDTENVAANVKTVSTQDSSGNNLQDLIEEVSYNSENNGFQRGIWVFGWGELKKYFTRVKAGCCLETGIDLGEFARQNPMVFAGDYRVPGALGTDNFIAVEPGSAQVLEYVEFEGDNVVRDESYEQSVIVSPNTGLKYDLFMEKDCSGGGAVVKVSMRHATKLVGLPDDVFNVNDRMRGVTGVNQYVIDNS